jgi:hypothetical protein
MHDVCLGHRAHVHEEFLVPWTAPVLGTPGGKWSLYSWSRDQKSVVWVHRMGLVMPSHLQTFVFVSGEPISEARILVLESRGLLEGQLKKVVRCKVW